MRVALLTNYIPPYRVTLYQQLEQRFTDFRILLSTVMEPGRSWQPYCGQLPVKLQRNLALRGNWKHPHRFSEPLTIHIPYDTVPQLRRFCPDIIISCELGMRTLQAAIYRRFVRKSRLIIWATLSEVTEQGCGRMRHWL